MVVVARLAARGKSLAASSSSWQPASWLPVQTHGWQPAWLPVLADSSGDITIHHCNISIHHCNITIHHCNTIIHHYNILFYLNFILFAGKLPLTICTPFMLQPVIIGTGRWICRYFLTVFVFVFAIHALTSHHFATLYKMYTFVNPLMS